MGNRITIVGRLGHDASVKELRSGTTVAELSVASDVGYGDKKQTLWYRCYMYGKRAESKLIDYLEKGKQVVVFGELATREYEKKDGGHGFALEVTIDHIELVGGARENESKPVEKARSAPAKEWTPPGGFDDDDIPF